MFTTQQPRFRARFHGQFQHGWRKGLGGGRVVGMAKSLLQLHNDVLHYVTSKKNQMSLQEFVF